MKIGTIIFSLYLLASIAMWCIPQTANCNDGTVACCSETPVDGENNQLDTEDSDDCSVCNPLACHCCVIFISVMQFSAIEPVVLIPHKEGHYLEFLPSSITFQIWQPPKIS